MNHENIDPLGNYTKDTKDSGKTYVIASSDLFEVLDCIMKKLEGKRVLDFSEYEDMIVGLPFNLNFTIREAEQK